MKSIILIFFLISLAFNSYAQNDTITVIYEKNCKRVTTQRRVEFYFKIGDSILIPNKNPNKSYIVNLKNIDSGFVDIFFKYKGSKFYFNKIDIKYFSHDQTILRFGINHYPFCKQYRNNKDLQDIKEIKYLVIDSKGSIGVTISQYEKKRKIGR